MTTGARYRHLGTDHGVVARLPTDLVARYRAVDREVIFAPPAVVDTPAHLDRLSESIAADGIRVALRMGFNSSYGYLDGNHRIAVALRLRLPDVPVELVREDEGTPRGHGQPMRPEDLDVILTAIKQAGRR